MTPKRIQAVVEKIHKCLSHIHNPNFSSFRHIEHLSSQKVEVKVRPNFAEEVQNLWLLLQKLQRDDTLMSVFPFFFLRVLRSVL